MALRDAGESDFMEIGFFKNLWFIIFAITIGISIIIGLLLMGTVYATSGIRLDPARFGLDDIDLYEQ